MDKSAAAAYVLYVDHQGHAAPLGRCYHATASRRLCSSINDRYPRSTTSEIDSAYCPQCLSFHDAATAATIGYCPKPTCAKCPQCHSIASISVEMQKCFYSCGKCDYTSHAVSGLAVDCLSESDIDGATKKLGEELIRRRSIQVPEEQYNKTLQRMESKVAEENRRRKHPNQVFKVAHSTVQQWKIEDLTKELEEKSFKASPSKGIGVPLTTEEEEAKAPSILSLLLSPDQLPLSISLRPRKSLRCRAEIAEGRPGIVLKPKLNPLEGDTSLRTSHGQWFKKDSSAILVVPRVDVAMQTSTALLLRILNPTLSTVQFSFSASLYAGEPVFDDTNQRTTVLSHLLVDSLRGTTLEQVTLDTAFELPSSQAISLDPVEDSFLDLGAGHRVPKDVQDWKGDKFGLVAQMGDKAWFAIEIGKSRCVAISMDIVVAKGSWESSLIKSQGKDDVVAFDLLLVRA